MLLVHYPKCSTCQSAKKWLIENGYTFTEKDIKVENPTRAEIELWYKNSGYDIKKFFNTSGLVYKELGLKDKLQTMSEDEKLDLLSTNGMLIKRPIVVTEDTVLVGFKEKEWAEKLAT